MIYANVDLAIMCPVMPPVKSHGVKSELGDTKRRIVDCLKRAESTPGELAAELGLTEAAVRQHLDALAETGLVSRTTRPPQGRGRPAQSWALTDLARDLFPDHHDDLTVELLDAVRTALGEEGLDRVIEARAVQQLAAYAKAIPSRGSLRARVEALARVRTAEGYVAEVVTTTTVPASCWSSITARSASRRPRAKASVDPSWSCSRKCWATTSPSSARSTFSPATGAARTGCGRGRSVRGLCALFVAALRPPSSCA